MERRVTSHTEEEEMNQRRHLLALARKGDQKAVKQLMELYQVRVYSGESLKSLKIRKTLPVLSPPKPKETTSSSKPKLVKKHKVAAKQSKAARKVVRPSVSKVVRSRTLANATPPKPTRAKTKPTRSKTKPIRSKTKPKISPKIQTTSKRKATPKPVRKAKTRGKARPSQKKISRKAPPTRLSKKRVMRKSTSKTLSKVRPRSHAQAKAKVTRKAKLKPTSKPKTKRSR